MKNTRLEYSNKVGLFHKKQGMPSQDRVYCKENGDIILLAIADGATACENSGEGAEIAVRTAAEYLLQYGKNLRAFSEEKMAHLLLEEVDYVLNEAAEHIGASSFHSFASTLQIAYIDKKRKEVLFFHLGDGDTAMREGGNLVFRQGRTRETFTPLTTMKRARDYMKIEQCKFEKGTEILMVTDGALELLETDENWTKKDYEFWKNKLSNAGVDDCSYIYFNS